jgi:class 3 adenylate cyclase
LGNTDVGVDMVETQYAKTPRGRIAYRSFGHGPIDVLVAPPLWVPVDALGDEPRLIRFLDRLSRFCRHIWFDTRGRGASDPMPPQESRFTEQVADDMLDLLDVLGYERVAVLDLGYGASSLLFAATHPERTTALALLHPIARTKNASDYPEGWTDDAIDRFLEYLEETWGTEAGARFPAPSAAHEPGFARWMAGAERLSCSPAEAAWRVRAITELDAREVLATIRVPTLVVTPRYHPVAPWSRYVANRITGARHVEVPSEDFLFFTAETGPMLDALEEFLTGRLAAPDLDRVLATVLFTDVVSSTEHAARLGDRQWRELLATHDTLVRTELGRFRGREIKTTGDGFLAIFDSPGRAIRAAGAIRDAVRSLGIEIRAGLHTGEVELMNDDVGGIAVHIGQRVLTIAQPGEVVVSSTVKDLVAGSGIDFEDRGDRALKGVPGTWRLFTVLA